MSVTSFHISVSLGNNIAVIHNNMCQLGWAIFGPLVHVVLSPDGILKLCNIFYCLFGYRVTLLKSSLSGRSKSEKTRV